MTLKEVYRLCNPGGISLGSCPDNPFQMLADAIVEKAVNDYCNALKGRGYKNKSAAVVKDECERFFRSDWFTSLSPLDGETVIQRLFTACVQSKEGTYNDER